MSLDLSCPCNRNRTYRECCKVFHDDSEFPQSAEQLMRSRYSAYALRLVDYLVATTHRDKLKSSYHRMVVANIDAQQWTGLEILKTSGGAKGDKTGKVKFKASYLEEGKEGEMIENSRFRKVAGRWFYYDGKG